MLHSKNKKEKLMITYINGEYKKNASLSVRDLSIYEVMVYLIF